MRSLRTPLGIMLTLMLGVTIPTCSSSNPGVPDGGAPSSTGGAGGPSGGTGGAPASGGAGGGPSGSGGSSSGGHVGGAGEGMGGAGGTAGAAGGHAGLPGGHAGGGGQAGGGGHAGAGGAGAGGHAGAGGAGAGGADALDQSCTSACAKQTGLSCQDTTCHDDCISQSTLSTGTGQSCKPQYTALLACEAKLPASDWICSSDEDVPEVASGQCMTTLCAWACCVSSLYTTSDVWSRCLPVCG